jgi:outer membrane lipoprotein carrier protein
MTAHHRASGKQRLITAALLFSVLASGSIKPAYAQTVQDVVTPVENHYRDLSDLTAKVVQKNVLKSIGKTQTFEGTLWIKKPGKLRLEYSNGQLILINNKAALFYSKKSEQVVKKTFTDFEHMNIPVAFLLGAAHIRDDFDVLQADPTTPRVLELLPRKPGAAMKKMRLVVDDAGRITDLTIFDRSGNTTTMAFTDIREGAGIDDQKFVFQAPKGTEIIEQ